MIIQQIKKIKKQVLEQWKNFENQLLESNHFNLLKEKYQSLSLSRQKIIKYGLLSFVVFLLLFSPLYYYFSSQFYWEEFKEQQHINLEMLKMREKSSSSTLVYSRSQLKNKIESITKKYTQTGGLVTDKKKSFGKSGKLDQIDFKVEVKHINIKQVIRLGTELNNLSQVRLTALTMEMNENYFNHYDSRYELSAFVLREGKSGFQKKSSKKPPLKRIKRKAPAKEKEDLKKAPPKKRKGFDEPFDEEKRNFRKISPETKKRIPRGERPLLQKDFKEGAKERNLKEDRKNLLRN